MIGEGHESQSLDISRYLLPPLHALSLTPLLVHNQLGHPTLVNQKMILDLSSLLSLNCESCQLAKHSRSTFPKRVKKRATSPFVVIGIWEAAGGQEFIDSMKADLKILN